MTARRAIPGSTQHIIATLHVVIAAAGMVVAYMYVRLCVQLDVRPALLARSFVRTYGTQYFSTSSIILRSRTDVTICPVFYMNR